MNMGGALGRCLKLFFCALIPNLLESVGLPADIGTLRTPAGSTPAEVGGGQASTETGPSTVSSLVRQPSQHSVSATVTSQLAHTISTQLAAANIAMATHGPSCLTLPLALMRTQRQQLVCQAPGATLFAEGE